MDFTKIKKIYLIGAKGVGMTMLGQYLAARGFEVSGSDGPEKYMTDPVLAKAGIKVTEKFSEKNIPADADLIIYSTAYNEKTNVEVAAAFAKASAAKAAKAKVMTYAQALGEIFNQKYGIAVVGSHGKTTVTAWLGYVMEKAGLSPNVMVGARVPQFDGCSLTGASDYLVIEADEYQNKLANYQPRAVLLNNLDYDHPDFFPTPADYHNAFIEFIKKIPAKGFLVANYDDPQVRKIAPVNCLGKVISYAINEAADYVAHDIKAGNGKQYFKVKFGVEEETDDDEGSGPEELGDFSIELSGRHNILNTLAVIATAVELGVDLFKIRKYLEEFTGTARRLEYLGEFRGAAVVDDYAHHPTEIKATLAAARERWGGKKITVVFHPHTFTRTKALFDDFAKSFSQADELILLDIYGSAREAQGGVSSLELMEKIKVLNQAAGLTQVVSHQPTLAEAEKYLRERAERGEVILLMGAGDVFRIGENLMKK